MTLGIDLGTTYSAMAWVNPETGKAEIIPNREGQLTTASAVYFENRLTPVVGGNAKDMAAIEPSNIVQLAKRFMDDTLPIFIDANNKEYGAVDISALILGKLKRDAEAHLRQAITEAVITVPAYFNDLQRRATVEAGEMAGLKVKSIMPEPTAAALYHSVQAHGSESAHILAYDLGGGTFDVTVMKKEGLNVRELGTNGDDALGGADIDQRLSDWMFVQFLAKHFAHPDLQAYLSSLNSGLSLQQIEQALSSFQQFQDQPKQIARFLSEGTLVPLLKAFQKDATWQLELLKHAENCKHMLSRIESFPVTFYLLNLPFSQKVDRTFFEQLIEDFLICTFDIMHHMLEMIQVPLQKIDQVLLVGGSTRILKINNELKQTFPHAEFIDSNQDTSVALGAAIAANLELFRPSPSPSGAQPAAQKVSFSGVTAHPLGLGFIRSGDRDLAKPEYYNTVLIPANSPIPVTVTEHFKVRKGKSAITFRILQGPDNVPARACLQIGEVSLKDLPYRSDSNVSIEVGLSYDENGIIRIIVKDLISGKSNSGEISYYKK